MDNCCEIKDCLSISGNKVKGTGIKEMPIDKKIYLTINEASLLFNIGITKIRNLTQEKDCSFVLFNGNKCLINRKKFEIFLDDKRFI